MIVNSHRSYVFNDHAAHAGRQVMTFLELRSSATKDGKPAIVIEQYSESLLTDGTPDITKLGTFSAELGALKINECLAGGWRPIMPGDLGESFEPPTGRLPDPMAADPESSSGLPNFSVIVNGEKVLVPSAQGHLNAISYGDVVQAAFPGVADPGTPSMTWRLPRNGSHGILGPGELCKGEDGMIFDVVHTGNA